MVGSRSSPSLETEKDIDVRNKELLEFYQNKFDGIFKRDEYKEKVDKFLKETIADRYELEAEVIRKGEKISDLQKALVDLQLSCFEERERFLTVSDENERLKKSEELLHENIRQLLSHTRDRDLRDRIIYILQDPNVEIHCRHVEGKSAGTSASSVTQKKSTSELLKEEIQQLQSKIEEYSRISKNNSDVVLEDCKVALEKSKEKILEDEQEIRKLHKRLQESEAEIRGLKQSQSNLQFVEKDSTSSLLSNYGKYQSSQSLPQNRSTGLSKSAEPRTKNTAPSSSRSDYVIDKTSNESPQPIASDVVDLKFSLASLTQISSKIESILKSIKSSKRFVLAAKLAADKATKEFTAEKDIAELQDCIRKCTRLSYDVSIIWKSVSTEITKQDMPVRQRDLQQVGDAVTDISVSAGEAELLNISLSRAKFYDYLVSRNVSLSDLEDIDKCAADVVSLEDQVKSTTVGVKTATDVIERIERNINLVEKYINKPFTGKRSDEREGDTVPPRNSASNSNIALESSRVRFQADTFPKQMYDFHPTDVRRTRCEPIGGGEVTRKIDKTLSKIRQIERGEYAKDNELCKHLAEQIRALSDRLRALYKEFNERNLQDNFAEYSSVTLNKLETLARQSRDSFMAAEAQISAYRSNAQVLSEKLRDTQELLRESISECLGLKRKLSQMEISRGIDELKAEDDPCQTFLRTRNVKETEKPKSTDNVEQPFFRTIDLDGNETSVKKVASSSKSLRKPEGPFECMFCKQKSDHKLCGEKIRELQAEIRKLNVQLKTLDKEARKEKKIAQASKEGADKANLDLENEKQSAKETIASLESKNSSLLDQLNMLKNRLKNMERYRRSEIEGFQTDIKNLKTKIKELEKQLSRAVLIYEQDQKDVELLKSVHATAQRSKSAVSALKRLKAKLYEIETDIKRM